MCGMHKLMPGEAGGVQDILTAGRMRRRLLDIGLAPGTTVVCVGTSPLGDPSAYLIRGAVMAIRACDGQNILVERGDAPWA